MFRTIFKPIAIALALGLLARAAVHIYSIPSASMAPTLEPGDQIVVTPYFFGGAPERGHIVVFRSPGGDDMIVKRIVGVPGDLVESRLGRLRVGGYTVAEPYVRRVTATGSIASQLIPQESYFVLGDNRDDSIDSRSWGVVPRSAIVGRARMILWSSPLDAPDSALAATADRDARSSGRPKRARLFKWVR